MTMDLMYRQWCIGGGASGGDRSEVELKGGKVEESGNRRVRAERAKDGGGVAVQIPCKHLQWICELFKRLNSLKNLVCTGAVCHRRHPPFVTLRHSLYRTLVVPPYPKLRATTVLPSLSLALSLFSLSVPLSVSFSPGSLTLLYF